MVIANLFSFFYSKFDHPRIDKPSDSVVRYHYLLQNEVNLGVVLFKFPIFWTKLMEYLGKKILMAQQTFLTKIKIIVVRTLQQSIINTAKFGDF